jgi:hypothetical protein
MVAVTVFGPSFSTTFPPDPSIHTQDSKLDRVQFGRFFLTDILLVSSAEAANQLALPGIAIRLIQDPRDI